MSELWAVGEGAVHGLSCGSDVLDSRGKCRCALGGDLANEVGKCALQVVDGLLQRIDIVGGRVACAVSQFIHIVLNGVDRRAQAVGTAGDQIEAGERRDARSRDSPAAQYSSWAEASSSSPHPASATRPSTVPTKSARERRGVGSVAVVCMATPVLVNVGAITPWRSVCPMSAQPAQPALKGATGRGVWGCESPGQQSLSGCPTTPVDLGPPRHR